jgi:hypothetical protein
VSRQLNLIGVYEVHAFIYETCGSLPLEHTAANSGDADKHRHVPPPLRDDIAIPIVLIWYWFTFFRDARRGAPDHTGLIRGN